MKSANFIELNGFKMPILLLALSFAGISHAEIYKCSYVDDAKQTKTVYTDAPCAKTAKKSLSDIRAASQEQNTKTQLIASKTLPKLPARANPTETDRLDQAVTQAVLAGNFNLAKQLASTKEHWRLIAVAEKPAASPVTSTPIQTAYQPSPCEKASADYDYNARQNWRDSSLVNTKRSIMYASCGIAEPIQQQPVLVGQYYGQQFGGITTSRWIAPNVGYGIGHLHGYTHQTRPYPHVNRHHQYAPQGLSIGYQNRHFGVRFGSLSSSTSIYNSSSGW